MKAAPHYDICEARKQIEAGRTLYYKRMEVMERIDLVPWIYPGYIMQGTGKFEMREVSKEDLFGNEIS